MKPLQSMVVHMNFLSSVSAALLLTVSRADQQRYFKNVFQKNILKKISVVLSVYDSKIQGRPIHQDLPSVYTPLSFLSPIPLGVLTSVE